VQKLLLLGSALDKERVEQSVGHLSEPRDAEPGRSNFQALGPWARKTRGNVARALVSGGRSSGFVQAATPAWVVFDKSGALTAIQRAR